MSDDVVFICTCRQVQLIVFTHALRFDNRHSICKYYGWADGVLISIVGETEWGREDRQVCGNVRMDTIADGWNCLSYSSVWLRCHLQVQPWCGNCKETNKGMHVDKRSGKNWKQRWLLAFKKTNQSTQEVDIELSVSALSCFISVCPSVALLKATQ